MTIATVGLFLLLVKLGFWQLDRANEKEQLHADLVYRQSLTPMSYTQLLESDYEQPMTGSRLSVTASPIPNKLILLDNQVYQGQVGYLAYQLLSVPNQNSRLLLELGFVKAPKNRQQLPAVKLLKYSQTFSGRLYQKSLNPMSPNLMPEQGWPLRIQNLDLEQLSNHLELPLAPAVLQADELNNSLPHPWQPIPMSAQKHRGYALQWFSLAAALITLIFFWFRKQKLTPSTPSNRAADLSHEHSRRETSNTKEQS